LLGDAGVKSRRQIGEGKEEWGDPHGRITLKSNWCNPFLDKYSPVNKDEHDDDEHHHDHDDDIHPTTFPCKCLSSPLWQLIIVSIN
jgi:hypothetical protein